uniref:Transmembrane protein 110 n=1 Tax=Anas platyrhynchos platyrhynchos TaxID=8840 RepID=A0A493TAC7_ANAPP
MQKVSKLCSCCSDNAGTSRGTGTNDSTMLSKILAVKRFKEPKEERRPWRIWFYDTSKQAIGALFIHFANIFLSDLTEEDPCSLYLINFILDATLGMLLIWLGVKVVSWIVQHQKYTYLVFGEYGDPPQAAAWIGQCILYLLIMVFEKTAISLVLLIPGWTKLQQILLSYIPNPQLELVLVMLVVPFIVNAIMFWVVDSLIMRKYYKQKDSLDINGSIETPRARRTEESQVRPKMSKDQEELAWSGMLKLVGTPVLSLNFAIINCGQSWLRRACIAPSVLLFFPFFFFFFFFLSYSD